MSRNPATRRGVGLEVGAIQFAVRATIVTIGVLVSVGGAATAIVRAVHRHEYAPLPLALAAFALVSLAVWITRTPASEWLAIAAMFLSVLAVVFGREYPGHRAQASTWVFLLAYFGIVLLSRRAAALWACACVVLWLLVAPAAGLPLGIAGSTLNMRWFSVVQLVVSAFWLWRVWEVELGLSRRRDLATLRAEATQAAAIRTRERIRVWRQVLVRTHETVLNDIRYLLDTREIDRPMLRQQLRLSENHAPPAVPDRTTVASLVDSLAEGEGFTIPVEHSGPAAVLDSRQESILRPVFLEVIRNVQRHSPASRIRVETGVDPNSLLIDFRYDTGTARSLGPSGIGTGVILRESLAEVGGSVDFRPDGVSVVLPNALDGVRSAQVPRIDMGRIVMSSVTAGNAVGGVIFGIALMVAGGTSQILTGVAALVVTTIGLLAALPRRAVPAPALMLAALLAVAVPLLIVFYGRRCGVLDIGMNVATLTGFGLVSAIVWAPSLRWWWLGTPWAAAMISVFFAAPDACSASVRASLVAASAPVIMAFVIYLSVRQEALRLQRLQQLAQDELADSAAAEAALDVSTHLHAALDHARALMNEIASGAALTPERRIRLKCLDAQIRSAIQVDPDQSGSVSRAARDLVISAAAEGLPVRVLAIRDSGNQQPFPAEVLEVLRRLLLVPVDTVPVIQVLSHGTDDTLIITTTLDAAQRAGIDANWSLTFEDGVADADLSEMAVVMVNRSAALAAEHA